MPRTNSEIRHLLLTLIPKHPESIASVVAKKHGVSRQAVNRHLRNLTAEGLVIAAGNTSSRRYQLVPTLKREFKYALAGLREDTVWRSDLQPALAELPSSVLELWNYGLTEMLNNSIDHSDGREVAVIIERDYAQTRVIIIDDGIGIFRKIKEALTLEDERQAVLELAKGKFTTDPANHTGEGIFFTSRAVDRFIIMSGEVYFTHDFGEPEDWILETSKTVPGTAVFLFLDNFANRSIQKLFDEFSSSDADYGFTRTVVPVRLAKQPMEQLVSRSQAKRLLTRFERFKTIILDFEGVDMVGQAFADEIFRVFRLAHPELELIHVKARAPVRKMIERALTNSSANDSG